MKKTESRFQRHKKLFWRSSAVSILAAWLLVACSASNDLPTTNPEDEIRTVIAAATKTIEARDLTASVAFISESYLDKQTQDKSRIKSVLNYIFQNQRTIHLAVRINEITFPTEEQAAVTLYAAMAATPITGSEEFILGRFDFYRFTFEFAKEDENWRVVSAQWRRATRSDLF